MTYISDFSIDQTQIAVSRYQRTVKAIGNSKENYIVDYLIT